MKKRFGMLLVVVLVFLCGCEGCTKRQEDLTQVEPSKDEWMIGEGSQSPALDPEVIEKWGREVYLPREESAEPGEASVPSIPEVSETPSPEGVDKTPSPTPGGGTGVPVSTPAPTALPVGTDATTEPITTPTGSGATPAPTSTPAGQTPTPAPTAAPADPCANGHSYDEGSVWQEASCKAPGDYCWHCTVCGHEKHDAIPQKDHVLVRTLEREGTCMEPDEYRISCSECDYYSMEDDYSQMENRHNYVTVTYQEFDEDRLEWIDITRTYCSICNKNKE